MTPSGWRSTTLRDVCAFEYGKSLPAASRRSGAIPVFGSNGVVGAHDEALVPGPGIVVGRKGSIGEVAWCDRDFWPIDTTYWVDRRMTADLRWLFYLLRALDLRGLNTATGIPGLNREDAYSLEVGFPPLGEQRKIAAILSSVDDAIEATKAVIDQLHVVKKAMMAELLTRGLPGRHTRFKMTEIGEVPEEWEVVRLADVSSVVRGSTPRPARDPRFFGGSAVPWITVGELSKDGWPFLTETEAGLTEEGKLRSRFLPNGTVVLSNSGFGCGVPKILSLDGCANDGIAAFLELRRLRPLFLYYVLSSMTEYLRTSVARGVEQPNLNTTLIGDLRLPAPSYADQEAISDVLFAADERLARERATLVAASDLKAALISVLLTGEVRVTPDQEVA